MAVPLYVPSPEEKSGAFHSYWVYLTPAINFQLRLLLSTDTHNCQLLLLLPTPNCKLLTATATATPNCQLQTPNSKLPAMQSAFLFILIFPPPATRPKIFSFFYRPGAWSAADTWKSLIMQRIVRNIIFADVLFYLF